MHEPKQVGPPISFFIEHAGKATPILSKLIKGRKDWNVCKNGKDARIFWAGPKFEDEDHLKQFMFERKGL